MFCNKLEIVVHPTFSEPEIPVLVEKRAAERKWRFPWRINMLAQPKPPITRKYELPPPEFSKVFGPLDPGTEFRADHLSRPLLRILAANKRAFCAQGSKFMKAMDSKIEKAWASIYNYYRKKLKDKELNKLRRKMKRLQAKKPTGKSLEKIEELKKKHWGELAQPKKIFQPPQIIRKWKPLEELTRIDVLAAHKEYVIIPPKRLDFVSSKALLYEATETILKLAKLPEYKMKRYSDPHPPGYVKPSALTAKCPPHIEKLAQPSFSAREAKKQDEEKYDPWVIAPRALKYKATQRMLELAKPVERD